MLLFLNSVVAKFVFFWLVKTIELLHTWPIPETCGCRWSFGGVGFSGFGFCTDEPPEDFRHLCVSKAILHTIEISNSCVHHVRRKCCNHVTIGYQLFSRQVVLHALEIEEWSPWTKRSIVHELKKSPWTSKPHLFSFSAITRLASGSRWFETHVGTIQFRGHCCFVPRNFDNHLQGLSARKDQRSMLKSGSGHSNVAEPVVWRIVLKWMTFNE